MSITDELREYANIATDRDIYAGARLCKIADRIDAEYRAALKKLAAQADRAEPDRAEPEKGVSWKEEARTWERRCKELIVERNERYIELPVDADGVPIRIGDVMEWPDCSTAEVVGIGDGTFFYVEDGEDAAEWSCASDKIHHHAPTVEDVLREFARDFDAWRDYDGPINETPSNPIADYAKRLRLAEEVDA